MSKKRQIRKLRTRLAVLEARLEYIEKIIQGDDELLELYPPPDPRSN